MKICSRCKKKRQNKSFRFRTDKRSGLIYLNSTCKKCDAEVSHEYHEARKNDPKYRKYNRDRARNYAQQHRDEVNERNKKRRAKPAYKKMMRRWRKKNRDRVNLVRKGASQRYTKKIIETLTDNYVLNLIPGVDRKMVREKYPELIELRRQQVKLRRVIRKVNSSHGA